MLRFLSSILVLVLHLNSLGNLSDKAMISGFVYDADSKQPLPNCNILVIETSSGTITDENGGFRLELEPGTYSLQFSYIGYETVLEKITIKKSSNIELNVTLYPRSIIKDEVTVTGDLEETPTIKQKIDPKDISSMPNIYSDVLRSVQVLSGVTTNNELSSGYNVRGGSFDENLIYLNGFEIYRPFLLRQGVEENQTLINPDLVSGIDFYNGGFSSRLGDRMSSALEVNYSNNVNENTSGTVRVDLMNLGTAISKKYGDLKIKLGARYAYPDAFLQMLQTSGDYSPSFSDIQLFTEYKLTEQTKLELLGLYAQNKFFLEPETWVGNFGGFVRGDIREISIDYSGRSEYKYITSLMGLRATHKFSEDFNAGFSVSVYGTEESEYKDITGDMFYNEVALWSNKENDEYLKTRFETTDNLLTLNSIRLKSVFDYRLFNNLISAGVEYRFVELSNNFNERYFEEGESSLLQVPINIVADEQFNLNNLSIFVEDEIKFSEVFNANIGLRYLRYNYSDENLFSPRINLTYVPSLITKLTLGWGFYYQPPFINELKNPDIGQLKSQRAIHYTFGVSHKFKPNLTFSAELYYKDLDNLIPFYFDELKMVYVDGNTREGYAYGIDLQIDGELIEDMRSIFGYSYLDSKERTIGTNDYKRRLLDQTHTLQIFLQDKIKRHPNWQSHLRFLFGSGLLFYNRAAETDPETGNQFINVDIENPEEYFLYFRVDMGLSASFDVFDDSKIIAVAEVLNVFNHLNYGSYDWVQALEEFNAPIRIPRVLSKRFFNVRVEFRF